MDIASLGLSVSSDQVEKASDALQRFTREAGKAQGATDRLRDAKGRYVAVGNQAAAANDNIAGSARRAAVGYEVMGGAARVAIGFITALTGALATGALVQYADAWSNMQSRVGAAIRDMDAAPQMMQRIVEIANASYSPLQQTVEIFSRNVATLRDMGRSAQEAADFTEALNNSLIVNATKGQDAEVVLNSLSRAIATGSLNAQDFDTIVSRTPRVLEAIASELGTTTSGLRAMAQEGKATSEVIVNGLLNSFELLRAEAEEMPATVGDAFVILGNNITAFIGQLDQSTGASQALSSALILVASNIDLIARIATVAGTAILVAMGPAILSQIAMSFGYLATAGVTAVNAITLAMARNPLGLLAVAVSTAIVALYQFRDEAQSVMGSELFGIVKTAANYLINSFRAAYEDLVFIFSNFGDVVGGAVVGGVNAIIRAINDMIQGAAGRIDMLISAANAIPGVAIPTIGTIGGIGELASPSAARLRAGMGGEVEPGTGRVSGHIGNVQRIMATDNFASGAEATVEASRSASEAIADLNSALTGVGGAATGAGRAVGAAANDNKDAWAGLRQETVAANEEMEKTGSIAQSLGSTIANTLRQGGNLWDAFKQAGIDAFAKIGEALLTSGIQDIIGGFGSMGGGGGGGIFSSLLSLIGFSGGGWTGNGPRSGVAGVVHGQEYVVKAGPAAQNRQVLDAINAGRPVPANQNSAAPASPQMTIYQNITMTGVVNQEDVQRMGQEVGNQAVQTVKSQLPDWQFNIRTYGRA